MDIIRFIYCNNMKMGTYKLISYKNRGGYLWFHIGQQPYGDYQQLNKLSSDAFVYNNRSAFRFDKTDLMEEGGSRQSEMNITRIIFSNSIRMGTFQLVQDLDNEDYFWVQVPPLLHDAPISINKSIWYRYYVGESCRYIFNKKDLEAE